MKNDSQGFAGTTAACFFQHSPLSKRNKNKGVEEEDPLLLCQPSLKAKLSVKSPLLYPVRIPCQKGKRASNDHWRQLEPGE